MRSAGVFIALIRFFNYLTPPLKHIRLYISIGLCILLTPFISLAYEGDIEKDLQSGLVQSRAIIVTIRKKLLSGKSPSLDITALKSAAENIKINSLLLDERFAMREAKLKSLGSAGRARHQAMTEGYRKALTEYLSLIDSLPSDVNVTLAHQIMQQLIDLLNRILPKKKRPIIGSLPYKHLNYPAVEPSTAPSITPAYRGGNKTVSPEDTRNTEEAPISKEIATLAQSLNWQPVAIYEYVKNNIETEWYWGCMKGAEETLHQKSGNDCDQALLLASLLKSAGFPTRLVRGTIEFFASDGKPIERVKNLTGIDDPAKIAEYFQKAGIPYKPIIAGGAISNFQIEHVWVESQIPYANYRGIVIDDNGKTWLGLDTSIKNTDYVSNAPQDIFELSAISGQLSAIRDEYLGAIQTKMPLEYLQFRINSELTAQNAQLTYNDFLRTKTPTPEPMKFLPASLQFKLIKATNEYTKIPDELIHKAKFTAADTNNNELFTVTLPMYKLSSQQVAISYEPETVEDQEVVDSFGGLDNTPAYLVRLRPVFTINKERVIVAKDGLTMGSDYKLTIELYSPSAHGAAIPVDNITNTMITGNLSVIGMVAQKAAMSPMREENIDAERLLYEEAINYINRWNYAEEELASLLHLSITRPLPTVVTLGGVIDVVYFMDMPHRFTWKGEYIDADLKSIETVAGSGPAGDELRVKTFMQISSLQGSVLEHRIFEDDFKVESISTAKLFQLATGNTQLVTIDKNNIDSILPTLTLDDSIKEDITNAVNQNLVVRIPQHATGNSQLATGFTYVDWTGIGYLKENPSTGESGWMLTGMIAGGMTAVSLNKWISQDIETVLSNPYNDDSRNIYITSPANETTVSTPAVVVTGYVLDPEATVTVNGMQADVQGAAFTATINLTSGTNTITAVATNKAGEKTFDMIVIRYKIPLAIAITYPFEGADLAVSPIYVEGFVSDPAATLYVNGTKIQPASDGHFIANGVQLTEGVNQIVTSAMNNDGDLATQAVTVNYHAGQTQPSLAVNITSPTSGATINKPSTTVIGTVTSTADEVWVTVNGIPAVIYGNQFIINDVPLTNGSNRIVVNAMDSNGAIGRADLSVTANTTVPYVQLSANITSGIAPLTTYFTLSTVLTTSITNYQMDYEGDGPNDYSGTTFDNITHTYTAEGIYYPKITVTDSRGNAYSDTIPITVLNKESLQIILKGKWMKLRDALLAGNFEVASSDIIESNKSKYRQIFTQLGSAKLVSRFENNSDLVLETVYERIANCGALRNENGEIFSYPVSFVLDAQGKWMIRGF